MVCWYCRVRESEAKHAYAFDMYGEVGVQSSDAQTNVAYNVRHIEVARCADCRSKHSVAKAAMTAGLIFFIILLGGVMSAVFKWVPDIIAGLWCGLAAGLIIACMLSAVLVQKGICSVRNSRAKFPEAVDLLKKGYKYGSRPKSAPQQSIQQPAVQSQNTDITNQ